MSRAARRRASEGFPDDSDSDSEDNGSACATPARERAQEGSPASPDSKLKSFHTASDPAAPLHPDWVDSPSSFSVRAN